MSERAVFDASNGQEQRQPLSPSEETAAENLRKKRNKELQDQAQAHQDKLDKLTQQRNKLNQATLTEADIDNLNDATPGVKAVLKKLLIRIAYLESVSSIEDVDAPPSDTTV